MKKISKKRKPRGYWTKEMCFKEALKYKTKTEFKNKNNSAYIITSNKGYMKKCSKHMINFSKPMNYWTKEKCLKVAKKCKNKKEFRKKYISAYSAAHKNKWIKECCKHMIENRNPANYWTKEKCIIDASRFKTKSEWRINSPTARSVATKNKWIKECCKHMAFIKHPNNYWTKKRCIKEALKYKTKTIFSIKNVSAYGSALRNNWIDECCKHMEVLGNSYKRMIYAVVFSNNHIYIGLTYNPNKRFKQHLSDKKSTVYKYKKEIKLEPKLKKLTDFLDKNIASQQEGVFKKKYEKKGYIILNKRKTGGLGGRPTKWTKEKCLAAALKCKTISEFRKRFNPPYTYSKTHEWLNEICSHMLG